MPSCTSRVSGSTGLFLSDFLTCLAGPPGSGRRGRRETGRVGPSAPAPLCFPGGGTPQDNLDRMVLCLQTLLRIMRTATMAADLFAKELPETLASLAGAWAANPTRVAAGAAPTAALALLLRGPRPGAWPSGERLPLRHDGAAGAWPRVDAGWSRPPRGRVAWEGGGTKQDSRFPPPAPPRPARGLPLGLLGLLGPGLPASLWPLP